MTNSNLVWRLPNKLTLEDIEKMLNLKIIDEKEAKQLTFNTAEKFDEIKALKEQIDFLKELVERLTKRPQTVWTYYSGYVPSYGWGVSQVLNTGVTSALTASFSNGATGGTGGISAGSIK